ncbi:MAG: hypothetical protein GY805_19145 [Chloroflexi bacterium]|nr:hypothetical protein [Chloroflexota bacterium]
MGIISKIVSLSWQRQLALIYLIFVVATAIFPHFPDSQFKWHLLFNFTLSAEMNLAVWLSGISLLLLALLSYELFSVRTVANKSWLILSAIFFALYLDEVGSLHERIIDDWSSLIPYAAIGFILLSYALIPLFGREDTHKTAVFILIGFSLFGLVAIQEIIEHAVDWPQWARGLRVGIEEGTELLGFFLCFQGIVWQRQRFHNSASFAILIPDPARLKALSSLLSVSLLLHFFSLNAISTFTDIGLRGNPAVLYPTALFLILAAAAFWRSHRNKEKRKVWLHASIYWATCSAGFVYLSHLLLDTIVWVPGILVLALPTLFLRRYWIPATAKRQYLFIVLTTALLLIAGTLYHSRLQVNKAELFLLLANLAFLSQLILLTAVYIAINSQLSLKKTAVSLSFVLFWLMSFAFDMPILQFLTLGLFAYFAARLFLDSSRIFLLT